MHYFNRFQFILWLQVFPLILIFFFGDGIVKFSFIFLFDLLIDSLTSIILFLQKSLEILGFSQEDILSIFKIIAVVLKLGNLLFIPITNIDGTEGCEISNEYGEFSFNFLSS
jgi:hypothetical protein